jgi:hypothetical protein
MFYVLYQFVTYLLTLPRKYNNSIIVLKSKELSLLKTVNCASVSHLTKQRQELLV